jgi:uncharacterized membrane protein HdeD (DUF308 family)
MVARELCSRVNAGSRRAIRSTAGRVLTLVLLALVAGLFFAPTLTLAALGVLLGLVLLLVGLVFFAARHERKRRMA